MEVLSRIRPFSLLATIMAIALAMLAYGFLNSAQSLAQDTGSGSDSPQLASLAATGTGRAMYPAFDSNTLHYAVGCGDNSILSLTLAASSGASLAINSATQSSNSLDGHQISGLNGDSDTAITVSKDGASRTYTVHCVHDDFPVLSVSKTDKAWDGLITLHTIDASRHGANTTSFIMIVDNNGVPQKHRRLPNEGISHFRTQLHGPYPYSYQAYKGTLSEPVFTRDKTFEAVLLDENLSEVKRITTVDPIRHTNNHDFIVKGNGNYILMAHEYAVRDFSEFNDENGSPYSEQQETEDGVIQEINGSSKQQFLWNSHDHMAIKDCYADGHGFPGNYAHLNSLALDSSSNILASFRKCSKVMLIDGTTGAVIWRLGGTTLSDDDWDDISGPKPLTIVNDPYTVFCAQHAARFMENGNLILFDNGEAAKCTDKSRTSTVSRAVEYAIDADAGTATYQRQYVFSNKHDSFTRVQGHVEPMPNGQWLISWGKIKSPSESDKSVVQVDPATGTELMSIRIDYAPGSGYDNKGQAVETRAYPVLPRKPAALTARFGDISLANGATQDIDMADYFSGAGLSYAAEVTTTHQTTGKVKTGPLNSVARNKIAGVFNGTILTLTGGQAVAQDLTLKVTATDANGGTATDSFKVSIAAPAPPSLIAEFDDVTISSGETADLDMSGYFAGSKLTYQVYVTTTHQGTGVSKTGLLGTVARNKVSGSWNGDVLTLTGGSAVSQSLTIEIRATDYLKRTVMDSFTYRLDN